MVYKLALFSNLLLASVATMAVPSSQLGARLARGEGLQSQPSNRNVSESNEAPDSSAGILPFTTYTESWAGVQVARADTPFRIVTATFTVPRASHVGTDTVSSVYIWVGLGGLVIDPACDDIIRSGLLIRVIHGVVHYNAEWQWYPGSGHYFPVASIEPGDSMTFTVYLESATVAVVAVINRTKGWLMTQRVTSPVALCNMYAGWIIQDPDELRSYIPFPRLDNVVFTDAFAFQPNYKCNGPDKPEACSVYNATKIYDIKQDNRQFTYTVVSGPVENPLLTVNDLLNW